MCSQRPRWKRAARPYARAGPWLGLSGENVRLWAENGASEPTHSLSWSLCALHWAWTHAGRSGTEVSACWMSQMSSGTLRGCPDAGQTELRNSRRTTWVTRPGSAGDSVDRYDGLAAGGTPEVRHLLETNAKMSENTNQELPVWAHRLSKSRIEQLYRSCGEGRLDEELIDDVGFSLCARCASMLQVSEAIRGRPPCPSCGAAAQLDKGSTTYARCGDCGWTCPWALYKKTYQRRGLFAGGMESFVRDFVRKFTAAQSHRERLLLIDALIHRFHWESGDRAGGRPGASSLIEGKMGDIVVFLDRLSYGEPIPPEVAQTREEWRRKWRANPWSRGRGQSSPRIKKV